MTMIDIKAGPYHFKGKLEEVKAPNTCAHFLSLLPYRNRVIHSRWSGEALWVPLGELETGLSVENHTCHPSRGDILFYPGGHSETEILFAYGSSSFASKMGALAGNHFITLTEGHDELEAFGKRVLWEGAQEIEISLAKGS
ncbi:MAG: DUF3830 family protein [Motiliproteus sp.]